MSDGGNGENGYEGEEEGAWGPAVDIADIGTMGEPQDIGGLPGGGGIDLGEGGNGREAEALLPTPEPATPAPTKPTEAARKRRRRSLVTEEEGGMLSPARPYRRSILGG